MVDPIGVKPTTAVPRRVAPVSAAAATSAAKQVADTGDTSEVALTAEAHALAETAPVDHERVAQIKRAIQNGTFPIYPSTIADRMIALKYDWSPHDAA